MTSDDPSVLSNSTRLTVRHLGLQSYVPIWESMKAFTHQRQEDDVDEFWILEHEPVFTQGQAGKSEHLIATGDIPVVQVDRGGQVTYHGPGQLIIYLLIDLNRKKIGVRDLVNSIEACIIQILAELGIDAKGKPDAPGVYVNGAKIASLGLRVRKGCTFHGLSLNIDMDLMPFLRINPCGYSGMRMEQIRTLQSSSHKVTLEQVALKLIEKLIAKLNYTEIYTSTALSGNDLDR